MFGLNPKHICILPQFVAVFVFHISILKCMCKPGNMFYYFFIDNSSQFVRNRRRKKWRCDFYLDLACDRTTEKVQSPVT